MPVINPALQTRLSSQAPNDWVSVIVILSEQTNVKAIGGRNRNERLRNLIIALQNTANRTQVNLRSILSGLKNSGDVSSYTPLWIINAIVVTGNQAAINALANQPEVQSIVLDQTIPGPPRTSESLSSSAAEQNLIVANAPSLWSLGYSGQGIVVANMDTGVDYTHPDLSAQWRGGSNSWYDPYGQHPTTPTDLNGHGTWTMGVMVGRDAGGTSIGMAPQASWIAVKIFNDSNKATTSAIHQGFQWLLNPDNNLQTNDAPNVVNNSWTFGAPGCDLSFEPDLQALVAAGITPVFAAGNFGPSDSTSASPANNPDAFAVGATDDNDLIYAYSSRGPTSCGQAGPVTYPAIVAPGTSIRTSDLYGLYYSTTGTSLAAPHVSGAIALLLDAFPNLSVADLRNALTGSALDLGALGPDNTFGNGRIDVFSAYNMITGGTVPTSTPEPTGTATPLPSATATATSTTTPAPSPTTTNTSTPLPTETNTSTPLLTATPTNTPTPLPTGTNTSTPLPTGTDTSTPLPTATFTATPSPTATLTSTPSADLIFADGFESGNLSAWSSNASDGDDLSVSPSAALTGAYGMQAVIDDNLAIYVSDEMPNAESRYRARFYLDPNSIPMASGNAHYILYGYSGASTVILRVEFRFNNGSYQLRAGLRSDGNKWKTSGWFTISDAPHFIEMDWRAATSAGANNGGLTLWIDGVQRANLAGVDNDMRRIDRVWLGAVAAIDSGTRGTYFFDAFESHRQTYIGP
jgi:subtilisin family serine protease